MIVKILLAPVDDMNHQVHSHTSTLPEKFDTISTHCIFVDILRSDKLTTIFPANSKYFNFKFAGRFGLGWTRAERLSWNVQNSPPRGSNKLLQINSNHSRRNPPQSIPCSPWNVTSKLPHQSDTEKPFVAFMLDSRIFSRFTFNDSFSW